MNKTWSIEKKKPFWSWVEERLDLSKNAVISSSESRKKKIFFRWRWGSSSGEALEHTRHNILCNMLLPGHLGKMKPEEREFWKTTIEFESKCNEYREQLELPVWKIPCLEESKNERI